MILFYTRCEVLPENACNGVPLNYDSYAIDIANTPELINFANLLRGLHERYHNISTCGPFLSMSVCLAEFPPCNAEINRLQEICESGCSRYNELILNCISSIVMMGNFNITDLNQLHAQFDCFDPETYLPGVPGSLYDTQQSCHDLFDSEGKLTIK